jgi:hypothetical protein
MAATGGAAGAPAADLAETPDPADELAAPEHPARSSPPPSTAPLIARTAALDGVRLVRTDHRFKLSMFSMPV